MVGVDGRDHARKAVFTVLKWLWLLAVIGFAGWYLRDNSTELVRYWNDLGYRAVLGALLALTIGRFFLSEISRHALKASGIRIRSIDSLAVNSVSQLGKYLPGSVWHLVGRVGLYRRWGATTKQASAVLILENGVLLLSGAGLALLPVVLLFLNPVQVGGEDPIFRAILLLAALIIIAILFAVSRRIFGSRLLIVGRASLGFLWVISLLFWIVFGIAFWLCVAGEAQNLALLPIATGVFAAGWIAGNLAPFAPAGVGVREAVIVGLLGPFVGVGTAIGAAAASRVLWTINELLLALPSAAHVSRRSPDRSSSHRGSST